MTATLPRELSLGQKIRWARKEAQLSHDKLGQRVGTSRQHLIRLEKGVHKPRPDLLERIAHETGQPLSFFSDDEEEDESEVLHAAKDFVSALMAAVRRREHA